MTMNTELEEIIRARAANAGGFLPFEAFMQAALYEQELGYYESKTIFGEAGDFVTAPELGPWLGLGFADLIINCWQQLGEPTEWYLLEQGSGSGRLLAAVTEIIGQLLPVQPTIVYSVERSHALRQRQQELFKKRNLSVSVHAILDEIGERENIIMFSNELPDAFPVSCFRYRQGEFYARGVRSDTAGRLEWGDATEPMVNAPQIDQTLVAQWPEGYISEYNPGLAAWQQSVARVVQRGFVLTLDYGYSQQEYYRHGRGEGSLIAHQAHQAVEDVLADPGGRDITAHVDFSALVRAGQSVGMQPVMWMSQGGWLAQSPSVQAFVQSLASRQDAQSMHLMAHAKRLLMPFGMGEVFKLLVQSKGFEATKPSYIKQFDHLDQL